MKTMLTEKRIAKLKPAPKWSYDVYDTGQPGLVLRVQHSGVMRYLAALGRGRWLTLGRVDTWNLDQVREECRARLVDQDKGKDPIAEKRRGRGLTFKKFVDEKYAPWAIANLKQGQAAVDRIHAHFDAVFGDKPLAEINAFSIERWRSSRLKGNDAVKPTTVNRDLAQLKACLSKAVEWGVIAEHPLRRVKLAKVDRSATVRFLSEAEEKRLRKALETRDDRRRAERESHNGWLRERHLPERPTLGTYTDHLTPIVLLALNTGLRRGELLGLHWADIDLARMILTVRGEGAKSGRTRHVPLNDEAVKVLKAWGVKAAGLVFPSDDGKTLVSIKTAWLALVGKKAANLAKFRFHDLRHHFASRLVQAGVDLNTVRELLGHSDFSLTLRYAHLAAENKAAAVAKLAR